MKKLENKSCNLKDILCAIVDGKEVQYFSAELNRWLDFYIEPEEGIFTAGWLSCKWRIKPDVCREWVNVIHGRLYNGKGTPSSNSIELALIDMWQAAMEHKCNE